MSTLQFREITIWSIVMRLFWPQRRPTGTGTYRRHPYPYEPSSSPGPCSHITRLDVDGARARPKAGMLHCQGLFWPKRRATATGTYRRHPYPFEPSSSTRPFPHITQLNVDDARKTKGGDARVHEQRVSTGGKERRGHDLAGARRAETRGTREAEYCLGAVREEKFIFECKGLST